MAVGVFGTGSVMIAVLVINFVQDHDVGWHDS